MDGVVPSFPSIFAFSGGDGDVFPERLAVDAPDVVITGAKQRKDELVSPSVAKKLQAADRGFEGTWTDECRPGEAVSCIEGESLTWDSGTITQIVKEGNDSFTTRKADRTIKATLVDGRLVWDFGGVWVRHTTKSIFEGKWTDETHPGEAITTISDDKLAWASGDVSQLTRDDSASFSTTKGGKTYQAKLSHGKLHWNYGSIWIRADSVCIDGEWTDKKMPGGAITTISGADMLWASGAKGVLKDHGLNRFSTSKGAKAYTAHYAAGQLVWNFGGIWVRYTKVDFDGQWTDKFRPGEAISTISGNSMTWASGQITEIQRTSHITFSTLKGDKTFNAEMVDRELLWDFGGAWIRYSQDGQTSRK